MDVSVLLRVFISSNEVCSTAYALYHTHEQCSIFKYTTMDPTTQKEMKYNLYNDDVQGDILLNPEHKNNHKQNHHEEDHRQ